jgi:xylose dehydrogenase (NAD/NADP)
VTDKKPLRIGILGAAKIARQFAEGVAPSKLVEVVAVASRDEAKAAAFAADFAIPQALASYEALLAAPDIDAIYLPLPNNMHGDWSIAALEAGKHVLCEKPLAVSEAEARRMYATAERTGRYLAEAYPYLAQPQTTLTRDLLRNGALGRVHVIRAAFGVPFSDPANIRLMPDLAGGSLMDAGSYAVSFVRVMAGERPTRVQATARWGATGVDTTVVATLEFASGLLAQVMSSFSTAYHRHAHIAGETGILESLYLNHPPIGGAPMVTIRRGELAAGTLETHNAEGGNGFRLEAESFARLVAGEPGAWTGVTPQESIDIAATLAAILESARTGRPTSL